MAFQDHGRAVSHLRNAIAAKPDYWEARYYLAMELAATANLPEAEQQLREVIRLRPDYVMAHINLGVLLSKTNRLPQAIAEFNQALKLDPNNQTARNYLQSLGASAAPAP